MSDAPLRRTIRRCTACLSVVLGAVAVDVAAMDYSGVGRSIGWTAVLGGGLYLLASALVELDRRLMPDGDGPAEDGDGPEVDGPGEDGPDDDDSDESTPTNRVVREPDGP